MSAWPALAGAVGAACGLAAPVEPREPIDWQAFLALANRHHVTPLLHGSGWAQAHGAPEPVCDALASAARSNTFQSLRQLAVQREVVEVLELAGVPVVVLKGPALGQEAYGNAVVRHRGDVDLLVAPADVAAAADALERHGLDWRGLVVPDSVELVDGGRAQLAYAGSLPLIKDATFFWRGVNVELHWRLAENKCLLPVEDRWLDHPRRVLVGGVDTPVLPVEAAWHYLLVHGARHQWMRMKWVADLPAMALRHPDLVAPDALVASAANGIERCVASGLLLAERVLGEFLDDDARQWARATPGTMLLVRAALRRLSLDDPLIDDAVSPTALPRVAAGRFSLRGDWRYRAVEAHRMLLEAGRVYTTPDPGPLALLAAPGRWVRRRRSVLRDPPLV